MADTQTIKDRIDIAQLIGEYITLKKAGANWKANCPFHHEKSPSFMVHPEKQIWHCFGCGKGGDIFSFIQEIEGLDFVEALKLLAGRAGVSIDNYRSESDRSLRNRLLEINATAAYFFHHFLLDIPAAKSARDYLEKRKLKSETITGWQIGYAADQWDLLTKYLLKKGFGIEDIVLAGLTIKREGADAKSGRGYYDRFRGRIMFPICDPHGSVVGFTGRVLVETETSGGKYVNTPQSIVYDKSRILYGLHKAKAEIKGKDLCVLVEGQMDVVACHQAGMAHVVAASGTALTLEQIKLIKRYTNNLAVAFDADAAGQNAGKRGIEIAMEAGMNTRVIQIPAQFAKDADECIKKDPAVWFKAVHDARGVMDWYFERVLAGVDMHNPHQKQQAATELAAEIARLPFAVERDEWLKRLAEKLSVDIAALREEIKKVKDRKPSQSVDRGPSSVVTSVVATTTLDSFETLLQELWSLLFKFPDQYVALRPALVKAYFVHSPFIGLYEQAESSYTMWQKLDLKLLRQAFQNESENPVDLLVLRPYKNFDVITPVQAKEELVSLVTRLKEEWRKRRGRELQGEISEAERLGNKGRLQELLLELQSL